MKPIDVTKKNIGINFVNDQEAEVCVWAPMAEQVSIVSNGTVIDLCKQHLGYWKGKTDQLREKMPYHILLNNNKSYPDPASVSQPNGVHGDSELLCIANFPWTDSGWKNLPLEQYIIYELHTGTFTSEGTFVAIENKLDDICSLGVTAIEIMPVAQFPGTRNWGYDGVYPFAVQNSYGGAHGLQHLVNCCHQKGIAVILDVVYNHLGPEGNYLGALGPYFTDKYKTPWGYAVNFDDAWCDGVRTYFIENALMWLRDFHVDALRLDAAHAIRDFSPVHILKEIRQHVDELMNISGRRHYLMVELDLNDNRYINPVHNGGYAMDAQWIDEFHHALRVTVTGERNGYYSDFNGVEHLAKAYRDAYVYDGQFSGHRKKCFGVPTDNEGKQFIAFSQNHDQVGNRMLGERAAHLTSFESAKLMAAALMVSPFIPLLFMGEEWNDPAPFLYFVSHGDEELAAAVSKGRKEEFAAFHAEGDAPDPIAEDTFLRSKLHWDLREQGCHQMMLNYYQALIELRKTNEVLRHLERNNVEVTHDNRDKTLVLKRWYKDEEVICLMNFSDKEQQTKVPVKHWYKLFDSGEPKWNGPEASPLVLTGGTFTAQPESIVIYSSIN